MKLFKILTLSFMISIVLSQDDNRIIGGTEVDPPYSYPFMAFLSSYQSGSGQFCGGSLIDPDWVLTAQHCVQGQGTSFYIGLNAHSLSNNNQISFYGVSNVIQHSSYDLALVRLSSSAPFETVDLVTGNNDAAGVTSTVMGWGQTESGWGSNDLLEVDVPIVSDNTCYSAGFGISSSEICAGSPNHDSCYGDSGGPLIVPDGSGGHQLAGVVSWGDGNCDGTYGVYAGVASAVAWINNSMENGTGSTGGDCVDCIGQDCTGYESWVGDGFCDDGTWGIYFNCDEYDCDGGDCDCGDDTGGTAGTTATTGGDCIDCIGQDCTGYESWVGDGYCDDGTWGIYFNCDEYDCDGGDCDCGDDSGTTGTTGTTGGGDGCVYDYTDYGSASCDTAWDEYGIDCSTLENYYGWDCEGCECPGDGATTTTGGGGGSCVGNCGFNAGDCWCDDQCEYYGDCCPDYYDECLGGTSGTTATTGGDCIDCIGQDCSGYESWLGDGLCDDGTWGIYFNCDEFDCDAGDCDPSSCGEGTGGTTGSDDDCNDPDAYNYNPNASGDSECLYSGPENLTAEEGFGSIQLSWDEPNDNGTGGTTGTTGTTGGDCVDCIGQDCTGYESWVGDGFCDDGTWGMYFNCDEYDCDAGDCDCGDDTGGTAGTTGTTGGDCVDCIGQDCTGYESWVGDGYCDDGTWGIYFNCDEYDCDGGDCDCGDDTGTTGTTGTTGGGDGCIYDYTDYGSASCDTAWDEYGIDCSSLESSYGWDCTGCECPGDGDNSGSTSGGECADGTVEDCSGDGDCCAESWIGDGYGDCEDQAWGCDLTCYDNDGGDCSGDSSDEDNSIKSSSSIYKRFAIKVNLNNVKQLNADILYNSKAWKTKLSLLDKMRAKSHLENQLLSQRENNVLPIPTKDYLAKRLQGYRLHLENSVRELESYVIYKNGEYLGSASNLTYTDYEAEAGIENCYQVGAVYTNGESDLSGAVCATAMGDPDVFLSFSNVNPAAGTVDIHVESSQNIAGFQFTISDDPDVVTFTDASGGLAGDAGFEVSLNGDDGIVIGFSLTGAVIPPSEGTLVTMSFTGDGDTEMCITEAVLADVSGNPISTGVGECVSTEMTVVPGDVNFDGEINVIDIVNIVNFILEATEPSNDEALASDMNMDGEVNVIDIVNIVNIILDGDGLSRGDIIHDAKVLIGNGQISINADALIAGLQLKLDGNFSIKSSDIQNGYTMYTSNDRVLIVNMTGNGSTDKINLDYIGEIISVEGLVADWNGNGIITEQIILPESFKIQSAYPNPFNPVTSLVYELPQTTDVSLVVYNTIGERVAELVNQKQEAGRYNISWEADSQPSGIYFLSFKAGYFQHTEKVLLLK